MMFRQYLLDILAVLVLPCPHGLTEIVTYMTVI